jgi:hypothetical protein
VSRFEFLSTLLSIPTLFSPLTETPKQPTKQLGQFGAPRAELQAAPRSQREASRELQSLEDQGRRDRNASATMSEREIAARHQQRRDRAMEILKAGMLSSSEDYVRAAMLFQHGPRAEDALLAHILASVALFEGDRTSSPFLTAASLDRDLLEHGRPQLFGTQSTGPLSDSIGEGIRREFRLDPLSSGPARQESRKARKDPGDQRARVERVLALVRGGKFDKAEESFAAASVLKEDGGPDEMLLAHVLYLLSAARGDPDGRRLAAQTLDRWLLSTGRTQRFGTQLAGGVPIEPCDRLLPESVRKAYGLAPLGDRAPAKSHGAIGGK